MRMFVLLFLCMIHAQGQIVSRTGSMPLDTLATVGPSVINATDFLERFELMPWPKKDIPSRNEAVKLEFLRSMVAEKLMSLEAAAMNLGNDSESVRLQKNLERLFVRDEFYKEQVLPKITVTDAERKEGMSRFPYRLEVEVLAIVSKADGDLLKKRVSRNKNKSSVFDRYKDSLFVPVDTLEVKYGAVDKMIEDAVYSIGKDSLSPQVVTDFGMVMFRLLKWDADPVNMKMPHADRLHKVENIIRQRKEQSLAQKAFADVTSPQRAEADPELFYRLSDSVISILRSDSLNYGSNGAYKFPGAAIDMLMKKFSADLAKKFITIASGDMTLNDVLVGLGNNNILFPSLNPEHIRIVLNNNIKTVIQNELLSREGLKKNLHQTAKVRRDLSTWMDSRKNWLLTRAVIDTVTVSEEEIEAEYRENALQYGAVMMLKVREILTDSIAAAMRIRQRLAAGEDFASLAKRYSIRTAWAASGGESPWFSAADFGELGQFADAAAVGQIVGPKQTKEGVTIFTVLEKKIVDDSARSNFLKMKSEISQKLLSRKQQQALNTVLGTLAKKYNVTIKEEALKRVKTTTTNMVTWRNIGFGGRVMAVPQMFKQAEWVEEWQRQNQLNQ